MPGDQSELQFDPRHDPRFQRGYDGAPVPSGPVASPPAADVVEQQTSGVPTAGEVGPDDEPGPDDELGPDDEPGVWETRAYYTDSSARRWLRALWWIGGLLVAFGVACLAYGIWANNDTAGQPYQDFWLSVFSSLAWGVYGAALTVGIMTLVATAVLQTLAPWLRQNR